MLGMQEDKESENFFLTFLFFNDKVTYRMPTESENEGAVLETQAIWRV